MIRSSRFSPRLLQGRSLGRRLRCSRKSLIQTCLNQEVFRQLISETMLQWNGYFRKTAIHDIANRLFGMESICIGSPVPTLPVSFFRSGPNGICFRGAVFVYKTEYFPFNAQQNTMNSIIWGSEKWVTEIHMSDFLL